MHIFGTKINRMTDYDKGSVLLRLISKKIYLKNSKLLFFLSAFNITTCHLFVLKVNFNILFIYSE